LLTKNSVSLVYQRLPGFVEVDAVKMYGLDWINYIVDIKPSLKALAKMSK